MRPLPFLRISSLVDNHWCHRPPGHGIAFGPGPPPVALLQHESIKTDIPFNSASAQQGVIFVTDSFLVNAPIHHWISDIRLWDSVYTHFTENGYDTIRFLPFSAKACSSVSTRGFHFSQQI